LPRRCLSVRTEKHQKGDAMNPETEAVSVKRYLVEQLEQAMKRQRRTKRAMAAQLGTSRSQLDRLLDPRKVYVSLETITRAAAVLGKRLAIELRDRDGKAGRN
jgi:antitoxin HicB